MVVKDEKKCITYTRLKKNHQEYEKNGKSIQDIAQSVGRSRKLVYNVIFHFEKHKTTENIKRKPPPRMTTPSEG